MNDDQKKKIILFLALVGSMLFYMLVFGNKNMVLGIMIVLTAFMNLGNDLSYKPGLSFIKVLGLLLILGVVSFLNTPITIMGCILTFFVVFGTTFSSYHLFGSDVYLPYLMCYFMMSTIPVTLENLPMRLLSLVCGAIFIVGLNVLVNRDKHYELSKSTIDNLIEELEQAIDLKLAGGDISPDSFKIANGFYLSLLNRFEYKYFPSPTQKSVLNIVKAFQAIGYTLSQSDLSDNELKYVKKILSVIREIEIEDVFEGIEIETREMPIILLNLEIIVNEINNELNDDFSIPDRKTIMQVVKSFTKRQFSFRSVRFTFAFKMALILFVWELLTLIFNLPFTKWLYFVTIPMMMPYIDDIKYIARKRIQATFLGVFIFTGLMIAIPYVPISPKPVMVIVMVVCMFIMVFKLKDKLILYSVTTIMSVMSALIYIDPPKASLLKILWVIVGVSVVSLFNFKFLPYSVEKETRNNLRSCYHINEKSIDLIREKCSGGSADSKTSLFVVESVVRENIEINDDNLELYNLQVTISNYCNFILAYLDINGDSDKLYNNLLAIIDKDSNVNNSLKLKDGVIACSMKYVMGMFKKERELIWQD